MKSKQHKKSWLWRASGFGLLVILAGILSAGCGPKAGSQSSNLQPDAKTAVLQDVQGWVEVESEPGKWSLASTSPWISAGQQVRTGKLSSARLVFNDGSQTLVKADSQLAVDELNVKGKKAPRTIVMTQVSGESAHQVAENSNSKSRYEVRTPSGSGTAKGTEFQVVVTSAQTAYYYVTEGVVEVSAAKTTVLVNTGFMTILHADQPPLEPIQTVSAEGLVSEAGSRWTVAGTAFTSNEETIIVGAPQVGDWVSARGHLDENKQNVADWIILLRSAPANRFSLTGTVEEIGEAAWTINGQEIEITETTELESGIQEGDLVYVRGLVEIGGLLQALEISLVSEEAAQPFSFTGIVQKTDGLQWEISGIAIASDETTILNGPVNAGDMAIVKGHIQEDGTWFAQEITLVTKEEREFSFTGKLESKDPWKAAGISFETREYTVIEEGLDVGDMVRVEGDIDDSGTWIATRIERVDVEATGRMVIIGAVITIDPWVVSGIPLTIAPDAVIADGITVGMLVRVEMVLQDDGSWQAVKIELVNNLTWFPGCMDVIATVVRVDGDQLTLENWPAVTVEDGALVEGELTPGTVIRMRVCFDDAMVIKVTYIIIIEQVEVEEPEGEEGGKVLVCHKPNKKKGGHTLSISRSALPAHLGHGDYQGACR